MLITILVWGILFFVFLSYGSLFTVIINKINCKVKLVFTWMEKILIGMSLCTALGMWFSVLMPLKLWPPLIILAGAGISAFLINSKEDRSFQIPKFPEQKLSRYLFVLLVVITAFFILFNTQVKPANSDTSLYHAQMIHWIEDYRVVPGLVHLHSRLAYNSSWLVLNALFSFSFINGTSYHVLPGFFFLITILSLLHSAKRSFTERLTSKTEISGIFSLVMIPLLFLICASEISSPGTDLPVILIGALLINYSLLWFESKGESRSLLLLVAILILYVVTVKLSAIPWLVLLILLFWKSGKERTWLIKFSIRLGLFFWIPWMTRSVIMSGYLVYPIPFPDIFNFDWKESISRLIKEQQGIRAWAINSHMDEVEVLSLPFFTWTKMWFLGLSTNRKILTITAFLSPVIAFVFGCLSIKLRQQMRVSGLWLGLFSVYIGLWYWLLSAPDIRFGFAYILPLFALCFSIIFLSGLTVFSRLEQSKTIITTLQSIVLLFILQMFIRSLDLKEISSHLVSPFEYPKMPTEICKMGDFTIFCAQSYSECWYEPFPCVPKADQKIFMRGDTLQDGFYRLKK